MFKENNQPELFNFENQLLDKEQQKLLDKTAEKAFYNIIFRNIKETDYKVLYSDNASRPNVAVNILVSALILKERKSWSYDELIESIMFDLRTKAALGLSSLNSRPFSRATIFNFQNRLSAYEEKTGVNLLEKTFDNLTAKQLKELKIKTDIQRSDSTLLSSNIKRYGRVELLIEVLLRLSRIFDSEDKEKLSSEISPYKTKGSDKYVYKIKSRDLPHELEKLGKLYHKVYETLKDKYRERKEFRIFERVYREHYTIIEGKTKAKPNSELTSDMLQSPDDAEATFRKKREEESRGFALNVTETGNPQNAVQLITDIALKENNIDDSKILEDRIAPILEKTPELNELHTDGGYGNEKTDEAMEENNIIHVTTAVRGRESEIEITITQSVENNNEYTVECPEQRVTSMPTRKRNKAIFDKRKCNKCTLKGNCNIFKNKGRFYFGRADFLKNKRNRNILRIPNERRKIRPNIEATIKEFKGKTRAGKLKVRGKFKATLFAFAMGTSINFGRIYRLLTKKGVDISEILRFLNVFLCQMALSAFSTKNKVEKSKIAKYFPNIVLIY